MNHPSQASHEQRRHHHLTKNNVSNDIEKVSQDKKKVTSTTLATTSVVVLHSDFLLGKILPRLPVNLATIEIHESVESSTRHKEAGQQQTL